MPAKVIQHDVLAETDFSDCQPYDIIWVSVQQLLRYTNPDNPNVSDDGDQQRLVGSMGHHGVLQNVVLNLKGPSPLLVAGHHRLEAAHSLGIPALPTMVVFMDPDDAIAASIALNAPFGHFEDAKLAKALNELRSHAFNLDLTALPPYDLAASLADVPDVFPEDNKTKVEKPKSFKMKYRDEDIPAILAFIGQVEMPEATIIGDFIMGRIRTYGRRET